MVCAMTKGDIPFFICFMPTEEKLFYIILQLDTDFNEKMDSIAFFG